MSPCIQPSASRDRNQWVRCLNLWNRINGRFAKPFDLSLKLSNADCWPLVNSLQACIDDQNAFPAY
jgi:hypothetical protein